MCVHHNYYDTSARHILESDAMLKCKDRLIDFYPSVANATLSMSNFTCYKFIAETVFMHAFHIKKPNCLHHIVNRPLGCIILVCF